MRSKLLERVANLRKALLIFHSPTDEVVGIDNASRIFTAAKHPKSFVSLAGADHLLSRRSDAAYVANVINAWAGRYLEAPEPRPSRRRNPATWSRKPAGALSAGDHRRPASVPGR